METDGAANVHVKIGIKSKFLSEFSNALARIF